MLSEESQLVHQKMLSESLATVPFLTACEAHAHFAHTCWSHRTNSSAVKMPSLPEPQKYSVFQQKENIIENSTLAFYDNGFNNPHQHHY